MSITARKKPPAGTVKKKLQSLLPSLSPTEARIAHHILRNLDEIGLETGASLAKQVSVSEISVSRFLRKAGYKSISALKRALHVDSSNARLQPSHTNRLTAADSEYAATRELEVKAILRLFEEFEEEDWRKLVEATATAQDVYVTGFQTVRGTAEDFARRLRLARNAVHYLSAHDDMLVEWLPYQGDPSQKPIALILIDVIPYSAEGLKIAEIAKELGITLIVISDEFCSWAHGLADHVIFARSRSGLYLESTVALVLILNVLVDAVARSTKTAGRERFDQWHLMTRRLGFF